MRSNFCRLGTLKKQTFWEQHFLPELLGRREIGLSSAGAKINEMIGRHVHMRGFVLVYMYYVTLVTTAQ